MSNCWEILNIKPTDNRREIRSAYAAQSKQYHPEEDSDAFAALNKAYQDALKYASDSSRTKNKPNIAEEISFESTDAVSEEINNYSEDWGGNKENLEQNNDNDINDDKLDNSSASLLLQLQQEEERKVQESLEKGALKKLIDIFDKAKETGKVPRANVWQEFFLSEEFLSEQYDDEFAKGIMQYLSKWNMEGNYDIYALPSNFLIELAIAYALIPEGIYNSNNIFQVNVGDSFYARECAASLWKMQYRRESFPIRIFNKPENLVRQRSFFDYLRLKNLNKKNSLTEKDKQNWEWILMCGRGNYLYELKGRGNHEIYEETRSVCLIHLYTFWIKNETVPNCILEYMYKEYDLRNVDRSSSKKIFGPLKQAIIAKHPSVEDELFGSHSKKQMISDWYRVLIKIVSDNHSDYDKGIYTDTEITKKSVLDLFNRSEWNKIKYDSELFEKIYLQLHNRKVVPQTLAERLIEFYSEEGEFEDYDKVIRLIESLIQSLAFNKKIHEIDGLESLVFDKTSVSDISDDNREFWLYYLMVGYGFRNADIGINGRNADYSLGSSCYLSSYVDYLYYPSLRWRKIFTGFDKEAVRLSEPPAVEFVLPNNKIMKVEFHFHYCLYFVDGIQVFKPIYTFTELIDMSKKIEKTEQFFFLLAITSISEDDYVTAKQIIEQWLLKLPVNPLTISTIALILAEGKEELEQISDYDSNSKFYRKMSPVGEKQLPDNEAEFVNNENVDILAVYYVEQEDYCLRAVITAKSVLLFEQKQFGWHLLNADDIFKDAMQMSIDDRKKYVKNTLNDLYRPQPVSITSVSLEGMDNEKKAEIIFESLKQYVQYRNNNETIEIKSLYPWNKDEISPALKKFLINEGRYLTESYCVLRFGDEKLNERVFYCSIYPYVFRPSQHNPEFGVSYNFRVNQLDKKVKEKHWIVGNFGWGSLYTPKEQFVPEPFAIGESGTYYQYDAFHMNRADNFVSLLGKVFDFTNVMEVEIYEGYLSISRFNNKLEYCYSEKDFKKSVYSSCMTNADLFVKFTKAEMMIEFASWLDNILSSDKVKLHMLHFVFECEKNNVYSLNLYDKSKMFYSEDWIEEAVCLSDNNKIVWKIWDDNDISGSHIENDLDEILNWYMDYGKYGDKLKACLQINVIILSEDKYTLSDWVLFKNINKIYKAFQDRTAMTAYNLEVDENRKPELFDSKFGGLPYWDLKKQYPVDSEGNKLLLLAQINLERDPMEQLISGGGMIQFFGDAENIFSRGFGAADNQDKYRIIYHDRIDYSITREDLLSYGVPDSTSAEFIEHTPVSEERTFNVEEKIICMGIEDYRFKTLFKNIIEEEFGIDLSGIRNPYNHILNQDERYQLERKISNGGHWILGYPDFAHNDPRKHNQALQQYDRLLFQFDVHYLKDSYYYNEEYCGISNFFIRSEDLEKKIFNNVMFNWEGCKEK